MSRRSDLCSSDLQRALRPPPEAPAHVAQPCQHARRARRHRIVGAGRAPPGGAGPPEGLMSTTAPARLDPALLRKQVDELDWYHTFDLPGGIVKPGLFDHNKVVAKLTNPESLAAQASLHSAT